jgi:apolipoprotein N-acyltransferase
MFSSQKFLPNALLCLISAVLLIFAFPKTDIWILSWIALAPLMLALDGKTPGAAFRTAYFCGVMFFLGTLYWFINMAASAGIPGYLAVLAIICIVMYTSLYFGIFGFFYAVFNSKSLLEKMFLYASVWAALEFTRDWLFTGFGWLCLGYSQYKILPLIQIVDITGVFGISFLIVMVNFVLKEIISSRSIRREMVVAIVILLLVLGYGAVKLQQPSQSKNTMTIAVIQPNVPQQIKWEESVWPLTMKKLQRMTEEVTKGEPKPDLIIWPETSFPGYIWESPELYNELKHFVGGLQTPLLFGAISKVNENYYNAAILLSAQGQAVKEYDKVHLVPFGEFFPFRNILTWLTDILGLADFTPGKEYSVFPGLGSGNEKAHFSVLICFEDTIGRLARRFVQNGANLLVNITNDAWFADSKEPFMHLQASVFRAVENRRGLIRAANTGVSCFIDKNGKIYNYLEHNHKKTFVTASAVESVSLEQEQTFYTKLGDVFTYFCFGCILWGIVTPRGLTNFINNRILLSRRSTVGGSNEKT